MRVGAKKIVGVKNQFDENNNAGEFMGFVCLRRDIIAYLVEDLLVCLHVVRKSREGP